MNNLDKCNIEGGKCTELFSLSSKTIYSLRLPLTIMVVFIHSFGQPSMEYSVNWNLLNGIDVYNIIRIFCSHVISRIAVPSFFLISGYLFFIKTNFFGWSFYRKQWVKRVHTLLIPYLIWNVIFVVWNSLLYIWGVLFKGRSISEMYEYLQSICTWRIFWDINSWGGGLVNILGQETVEHTGPVALQLWFLRDLMLVVLVSPLICWLIRKIKGIFIFFLGIVWILEIRMGISQMFITASFFFSLGAYFAIFKKDFAMVFKELNYITLPLWIVLMAICVYYDGDNTQVGFFFFNPMVLSGVSAVIGITALILSKENKNKCCLGNEIIRFAADNSFYIYVSHGFLGLFLANKCIGVLDNIFL